MRRLALLATGGALWLLLLAATPVFADGGPHQLANNNGTSGLAGDCAACHRAHTAQAADLLKEELPGLCLSCHNGTGATADVVDGVQYTPDTDGTPTTAVLGALRGGGFSYALIGDPARLSYQSRGSINVVFDAEPTSGSVTLTWPAFAGFAGGTLTFNATDSAATVQTAATARFGTSTTYSGSGATGMTGLPAGNANVIVGKTFTPATGTAAAVWRFSFTLHNEFRLVGTSATQRSIPLPSVTSDTTGQNATVVDGLSIGGTGKVGVLAAKAATTSNHMAGNGVVWGNGAQGTDTAGATGVVLDCAKCHNPHGNGQYRILQTQPGEDWNGATGVVGWEEPVNKVAITDATPATLTAGQVRNYTVRPSTNGLTNGIVGTATDGDYWRYKYDPSGTTNFTNFYLNRDPMNSGFNGTYSSLSNPATANASGAMTAWCIQCHTRYDGNRLTTGPGGTAGGPPSLNLQQPADAVFMYKHGTTGVGCEQCHVSHGTNRVMQPGTASADVTWPSNPMNFTPGAGNPDSRLLKVDNRGTCQLCHDPTNTTNAGLKVGTVPAAITPGP